MEDVEKYDSFLKKSSYLDSPDAHENNPVDNLRIKGDRRKTAGFGGSHG